MERYQSLGPSETASPEVADNEAHISWLRYRERTNLGIRRNLEELRRIQSDRDLQARTGIIMPGVASLKTVLSGLKLSSHKPETAGLEPDPEPDDVKRSEAILHTQLQEEERRQLAEFGKVGELKRLSTKPSAPCNAPCPCKSGRKYKLCCGHWSRTDRPESGPA